MKRLIIIKVNYFSVMLLSSGYYAVFLTNSMISVASFSSFQTRIILVSLGRYINIVAGNTIISFAFTLKLNYHLIFTVYCYYLHVFILSDCPPVGVINSKNPLFLTTSITRFVSIVIGIGLAGFIAKIYR